MPNRRRLCPVNHPLRMKKNESHEQTQPNSFKIDTLVGLPALGRPRHVHHVPIFLPLPLGAVPVMSSDSGGAPSPRGGPPTGPTDRATQPRHEMSLLGGTVWFGITRHDPLRRLRRATSRKAAGSVPLASINGGCCLCLKGTSRLAAKAPSTGRPLIQPRGGDKKNAGSLTEWGA